MADRERGPEKIDVEAILAGVGGAGADAGDPVEVLDPATGQPVKPHHRESRGEARGSSEELEAALAEKNKYYDLWVRGRAEFENYQKRIERERGEERTRAGATLVETLLPTLDNLDRALAAQPAGDPFREGIALIRRQLGEALARGGLETIEALHAPFDPVYHEAVMTQVTEAVPPGHVTEEIQKGYTFHGRVLRPTLVKVSMAAASVPSAPAEPEGTN